MDRNNTGIMGNPYRPVCEMSDMDDDFMWGDAAFIAAARNVLTPEHLQALCAALASQQEAALQTSLTIQEDEAIDIINTALDDESGDTDLGDVMCYQVPILLSALDRLAKALATTEKSRTNA